jgi:adenylyltransferase/sulfurtransferase
MMSFVEQGGAGDLAGDEISAEELRALLAGAEGREVQLLDVREGWERLFGAIKPSAHVPLGALGKDGAAELLAKQGVRADRRTVVYCAGGVRSLKALAILRERLGFARAQSLRGGFKGW